MPSGLSRLIHLVAGGMSLAVTSAFQAERCSDTRLSACRVKNTAAAATSAKQYQQADGKRRDLQAPAHDIALVKLDQAMRQAIGQLSRVAPVLSPVLPRDRFVPMSRFGPRSARGFSISRRASGEAPGMHFRDFGLCRYNGILIVSRRFRGNEAAGGPPAIAAVRGSRVPAPPPRASAAIRAASSSIRRARSANAVSLLAHSACHASLCRRSSSHRASCSSHCC